jgi:hypothetical protein
VCGTRVTRWLGSFVNYDYVNGNWSPQEPVLGVGESALVCRLANTNCVTNCCSGCTEPYPLSYQVVLPANVLTYAVNHLCHGTNNTLGSVLPNVPPGTILYKYIGGSAVEYTFDSDELTWYPDNNTTLNPGEGFAIKSPVTTTLTFTGCAPNCPPPCLPTNYCGLVGRLGIGSAWWTNLSSCPPVCGTRLSRWNGTGYDNFDYVNGNWSPQEPVLAPGQSAFVCLLANTNCFTNCCSGCTEPYPLSYQVVLPANVLKYCVNSLCHGTNNTLDMVLPDVPDGTIVYKYAGGWVPYQFSALDMTWNGNTTLNPGEGFAIQSPVATTLTFTGCEPHCPPPCLPTNHIVFVGRLGIGLAGWTNLSSCPPVCGTRVTR